MSIFKDDLFAEIKEFFRRLFTSIIILIIGFALGFCYANKDFFIGILEDVKETNQIVIDE